MRSAVIISLAVVGLSALSPAAKACGLYGLNHHMDKGNYTIAPFKPDPETTPVFKPKVYTSDPALTRRKPPVAVARETKTRLCRFGSRDLSARPSADHDAPPSEPDGAQHAQAVNVF